MSIMSFPSSHNGDFENLANKKEALAEMGDEQINIRTFLPDSNGKPNASRNQLKP